MRSNRYWFILAAAPLLLGFGYQATRKVQIKLGEKIVSKEGRMIDGRLFAPVDEILKPFDYKASLSGSTAKLVTVSGVAQREGLTGSMGVAVTGKIGRVTVKRIVDDPDDADFFYVEGTIQASKECDYGFPTAVVVFEDGKQQERTMTSSELNGGVYASAQKGETVNFRICFKRTSSEPPTRVVITFSEGQLDIKEVFRIRLTD